MYGINEKVFIGGIAVIFVSVVIAGVIIWQLMVLWLKNKREERRWEGYQREQDRVDRCERERNEWILTVKEQAERNERMVEKIEQITKEWNRTKADYNRAKQLMEKVNLEGLEIK